VSLVSDLVERARTLIFRSREERELEEEIRFHIDMEAEQQRRSGLDSAEAKRRGIVAFGGVERIKEDVRDARGTRLLEDSAGDVRWSLRTLRRSPRFAIVAVLTLAIGIGGTTAVFSAVNAVLLEPLPYSRPGQLVRLYQYTDGYPDGHTYVTDAHFRAFQHELASFSGLAAVYDYSDNGADIGGAGGTERIRTLPITAGYFDVLRVKPHLGHSFEERDETGAQLVILSNALWKQRFAGDRSAIGQTLEMDGVPRTIVGVMPDGFSDPVSGSIDAWIPIRIDPAEMDPGNHYLTVVGRLAPGVEVGRARAELETLDASLAREFPTARNMRTMLVPLKEDVVGSSSRALELMLGAVGLVLLLVCVNIANLMLVRGSERGREFALRSALGAGGDRLVRQLLTESITLALAGALAGLAVAAAAMKLLVHLSAGSIPRLADLTLDPRVLAFSLTAATASALIFGLAPARKAARSRPADVLREQGRSATGGGASNRLRSALVVAQVALAFMLLAASGVLLASLQRLHDVPLGVQPANVLAFDLNLPAARYDSTARARFYDDYASSLERLPGVRAVGGITRLPATGLYNTWGTLAVTGPLAGESGATRRSFMTAEQRVVSGDYFRAVGIPLLEGRLFDARDDARAPRRVVVSRSLADGLFPGIDPLGQRLHTGGFDAEIIGVVGDVAVDAEGREAEYVYHAHRQFAGDRNWALTQVVSTTMPPEKLIPAVRRATAELDPQLVVYRPTTLEAAIGRGSAQRVFILRVLLAFAGVALFLAALGLFGVLSYGVRLRSRELGIRMALGAEAGAIRGMVIRQGLLLTAIGIAVGAVGAIASSRLLASLVFQVSALDPRVLGTVALLMTAVAALAAYLPARHATSLDPRSVLQGE
jgi:predicted permease